MASKWSKARAAFEAAKLEAARMIAADPERYAEGSLMAIWADLILEASDEAGQVCMGLDRPAGFAASSIDGMRRSISRSVPELFSAGNEVVI